MTIQLSPAAFTLTQQQAQAGGFADVSQYLETLIEAASEKRRTEAETVDAIREGLADVAAGQTRPAGDVLSELGGKHGLDH